MKARITVVIDINSDDKKIGINESLSKSEVNDLRRNFIRSRVMTALAPYEPEITKCRLVQEGRDK